MVRLGWRWAGGSLVDLSVKVGLAMQLGLVVASRQAAHAQLVQEALESLSHMFPEG